MARSAIKRKLKTRLLVGTEKAWKHATVYCFTTWPGTFAKSTFLQLKAKVLLSLQYSLIFTFRQGYVISSLLHAKTGWNVFVAVKLVFSGKKSFRCVVEFIIRRWNSINNQLHRNLFWQGSNFVVNCSISYVSNKAKSIAEWKRATVRRES